MAPSAAHPLSHRAKILGARRAPGYGFAMKARPDRIRDEARAALSAAALAALSAAPGWRVLNCVACFAYVGHPDPLPSNQLAPLYRPRALAADTPRHDVRARRRPRRARHLRIAFANVSVEGLETLGQRLAALRAVTA